MADVFAAEDTHLGRRVALKLLRGDIAGLPGARERLLREGRAAALIRHPHVIQVFASGAEQGTPYLAMELLHGQDLAAILARHGSLAVDDALDLLLPVVAAVAAAHDVRVVHRDLKPSNVFVAQGPGGRPLPKVLDFGVSRVLADAMAEAAMPSRQLVGTVEYMAPEQATDARNASFRSDQYSLATVLHECLTGRRPAGPSAAGMPETLGAVVMRALSPSPEDRFPSVRLLGSALLPLASERTRLAWSVELCDASGSPHPVLGEAPAEPTSQTPTLDESAVSSRRPDLVPRVLGNVDGLVVAEIGCVCVVIWRAPVTRPLFALQSAGLQQVVDRHPDGAGFVCIIEASSSTPPDQDLRRASAQMIGAYEAQLKFVACIVEGRGFKGAIVRSALAGMRLLVPGKATVGYFGTVAAAANRLAGRLPIGSEDAFVASVENLRSFLGRPPAGVLNVN